MNGHPRFRPVPRAEGRLLAGRSRCGGRAALCVQSRTGRQQASLPFWPGSILSQVLQSWPRGRGPQRCWGPWVEVGSRAAMWPAGCSLSCPTATGMWALVCCDDFSLEKGACWKDTREKVGDGPQGGGTRDSSCGETGAGVRVDACKGTASPWHR